MSPKWVPQMADAAEVMARIRRKPGVRYPVLTPNLKGFEAALAAKADEVAVFVAASETFSRKNINCSIAESLERARPIFAAAKAHGHPGPRLHLVRAGMSVRGRRSTEHGSPMSPRRFIAKGAYEVSLGDTIGVGTAGKTKALVATVAERVPIAALAGHFHDTYGQALTNVYAAMEMGVATFDARSPGWAAVRTQRAPPATSRARTCVYLLEGLGIETGVDMTKLRLASCYISDLSRPPASRVARALAAKDA